MRIQASAGRRKTDIRDDQGIGKLTLTAHTDKDREFTTSVYRIVAGDDDEELAKGVAWMREYLTGFPPFNCISPEVSDDELLLRL